MDSTGTYDRIKRTWWSEIKKDSCLQPRIVADSLVGWSHHLES